jgi:hypothetical protein
VQGATRPSLVEAHRGRVLIMTVPEGRKRKFEGIVELAQRATANALGKAKSEWLGNGQELTHSQRPPGNSLTGSRLYASAQRWSPTRAVLSV